MEQKRGEITVFLSLILVCCLSLFLGLLESARTAGSRLYLEMAAHSAMSSVMSQYNRNLWDMYHLLFLEAESEDAVKDSFETYLSFYTKQENLYPMKMEEIEILEMSYMNDFSGKALEEEIVSYMKYRLPDIVDEMGVVSEAAQEAGKAGDFKQLFDVCLHAGAKTRKLEKSRKQLVICLENMKESLDDALEAAGEEQERKLEKSLDSLVSESAKFPVLVTAYEKEVERVSDYRKEVEQNADDVPEEKEAASRLEQELQAFSQMEEAAREQLQKFKQMKAEISIVKGRAETVLSVLDSDGDESSDRDSNEEDWEAIRERLCDISIPTTAAAKPENEEKALALDGLEALFSEGLLSLTLSDSTTISANRVSLRGIPSKNMKKTEDLPESALELAGNHFVVNEYCLLSFDTFLEEKTEIPAREAQPLKYEMEYLLSGNNSDRENLADTVESLIFVRAAMNLCYLAGTPERKAEADGLAAAVSGGNIPLQVILGFFILTLWSMGEAILDVRQLLAGGSVSFWKDTTTWKLNLEQLLSLEFLEMTAVERAEEGTCDYKDYLRVLCFLLNREEKNGRIMDLLQWNVRTKQLDFAVEDCIGEITIQTNMRCRHLFFEKEEYVQTVEITGDY